MLCQRKRRAQGCAGPEEPEGTGQDPSEKQVGWSKGKADAILSFSFVLSDGSSQVLSLWMVKNTVRH